MGVKCLAFAPGHCLATASVDNTLKLFDMRRKDCLATLKGHAGDVLQVINLKNKFLVSSSADQTIKVWEIAGCRCRVTLRGHTGPVLGIAKIEELEGLRSSRDEDLCFASCSEDRAIKFWGPE